jgi:hypothetical protein
MEECKNEDELMDAIKDWVWYDEQNDAQIPYDIALEAIHQALNISVVINKEVAVCEIEGCNREVLSDSTMCPHHFAVSLDSQMLIVIISLLKTQ